MGINLTQLKEGNVMFSRIVNAVRLIVMGEKDELRYSARIRTDVHPPTAIFHCKLDDEEYLISIIPINLHKDKN